MKVLMDTSVLVAAMLPDHMHHQQSRLWFERLKAGALTAVVSAHGLAELYSVLTRLPRAPRITPAEALKLIQENVLAHAAVATRFVKVIFSRTQSSDSVRASSGRGLPLCRHPPDHGLVGPPSSGTADPGARLERI